MTNLNTLIERINEIHASSGGYVERLQGINTIVLALVRRLVNTYATSIDAIQAMVEAVARIGQLRSPFIAKLVSDILPLLEAGRSEVERTFVSGLESLKVTFFWRVAPPTGDIARNLVRLREKARSRIPQPVTEKVTEAYNTRVFEPVSRVREVYRVMGGAPIPLRPAIEAAEEARRVSEIKGREMADFYRVSASIMFAPPSLLEVSKAVGDHVRRVSAVMEEGMAAYSYGLGVPSVPPVARTVTEGAIEAPVPGVHEVPQVYPSVKAMEAVKPLISAFPRVRMALSDVMIKRYATGREMADLYRMSASITRVPPLPEVSKAVGDHARRVSDVMEEGMAAYSYALSVPAVPPVVGTVAERATEAPAPGIPEAPQVYPAEEAMDAVKPLISTFPRVRMALSDVMIKRHVMGREMVDFYRVSASITRAPPLLEVSKAVGDHARRVSDVMEEGMAAYSYRLSVPAAPPVEETVAERAIEAPVPGVPEAPQVYPAEKAMEAVKPLLSTFPREDRPLSDVMIKRYVIGREMADLYRMRASITRAPPLLEVSKAVGDHVRIVSEVMVEGMATYGLSVPAAPPVEEAVAERAIEAPVPGVPEAPQVYPAEEAMEAVKPLISAVSRVRRQFPEEIKKRYLELAAEAPPVREYLAVGARLGMVSGMDRGLEELERGKMKEPFLVSSSVVGPPSIAEAMRAVSSYGGARLEMNQALNAFGTISKAAAAPVSEAVRAIEERAIKSFGGRVTDALSRAPVGSYALERVPLGPMVFPTVRLQEVIPLLHSIPTSAKTSAIPSQSTVNLNITVESLRDEGDLRELERKITRILKEQARRYRLL